MAATLSAMVELGSTAPAFSLPDVTWGSQVALSDFTGFKGLLVIFLSRHCPYVQHVKTELGRLGRDYAGRGLAIVGIASNDVRSYPDDAPGRLKELAASEGWRFPVLFDETQEVARAYHAACTPDYFLYDRDFKLVYRGQLDSSRPGNGVPVTGSDLRAAASALLAGQPIPRGQRPSLGCSIKWRP
ncbi:MAG: thioredoxin family protein [Elusimicrobia bacterium]|nr:thioredoxin family protein [Elusimicrobiota bacterium]